MPIDRVPHRAERSQPERLDRLASNPGDYVAAGGWILEPSNWEMPDAPARPETPTTRRSSQSIANMGPGGTTRSAGWRRWLGLTLVALLMAVASAAPRPHCRGEIRIAEQFGIVYLLLNVVRDQKLIEKHGKQEGIDIKVDWTQLSGGAAVNDALLSGSIDIAGAGVGPLLTIWDRTTASRTSKPWPPSATSRTTW